MSFVCLFFMLLTDTNCALLIHDFWGITTKNFLVFIVITNDIFSYKGALNYRVGAKNPSIGYDLIAESNHTMKG